MEEEKSEGANYICDEEFNDDLKKLIDTMSDLNIQHERTLHSCYSDYFHQKVAEFENAEQQIGLLSQLFITKSNDLPAIEIAEERNVILRNIRQSFDCIKTEGFGLENLHKSSVQSYQLTTESATNPDIQIKPKSGDNFCDFVLKDFDQSCDNETEMIGYGMATPRDVRKCNINSPMIVIPQVDALNTDEVDLYQAFINPIFNSNIPPRLRFKRRFLTKLVAETEIKRKREIQINNNNE